MFCKHCGCELRDGQKFCENCGAKIENEPEVRDPAPQNAAPEPPVKNQSAPFSGKAAKAAKAGEKISDNIFLCADGKYRWVYEMSLFKNPTIALLVWKVMMIALGIVFAIATIADVVNNDGFDADAFLGSLKIFGIIFLVITALTFISYLIYAAIMGGKYCVMFVMNETEIVHEQMPKQAKKAKILAGLTTMAGASSGNLTMAAVGIGAARTQMTSVFSSVRKVKTVPSRNLIKVNQLLSHNQVYCEKEDFEFVSNYIIGHCPNLK